ncbi:MULTISPECIES: hypothetical protein [unclassified Bradyrhizobium]|uniref:hypothetical protein n=1 Tax=unclassified Bradyrhizobium TaxID=2631580 RepID=UPI001FD95937|nr:MULTISPECIES: hypothetical protein [unclassified Bradyrhizobium]
MLGQMKINPAADPELASSRDVGPPDRPHGHHRPLRDQDFDVFVDVLSKPAFEAQTSGPFDIADPVPLRLWCGDIATNRSTDGTSDICQSGFNDPRVRADLIVHVEGKAKSAIANPGVGQLCYKLVTQ